MNEKIFNELEAKIRATAIADESKRELLQLLAALKAGAEQKQNLQPLKNSVEEIRSSVDGFEQSHPKLVQAVNNLSNLLSNLGI